MNIKKSSMFISYTVCFIIRGNYLFSNAEELLTYLLGDFIAIKHSILHNINCYAVNHRYSQWLNNKQH